MAFQTQCTRNDANLLWLDRMLFKERKNESSITQKKKDLLLIVHFICNYTKVLITSYLLGKGDRQKRNQMLYCPRS